MIRPRYLSDWRRLGHTIPLLRKGGIAVIGVVLADWLSRVQLIVTPLVWKWILDNLIRDRDAARLAEAAGLYLLAGVALLLFGIIHSALVSRVGERVSRELRERLFDRLESTRPEHQAREESGALIASFTNDLPAVEALIGVSLSGFLASALNSLVIAGFLGWLCPPFLLFCLAVSILPMGATILTNRRAQSAFARVQEANERVVVTLSDLVEGRRELMILGGLRRTFSRIFGRAYADRYEATRRLAVTQSASRGVVNFMFYGALVAIFFLAFFFAVQGKITVGTAVAILEFFFGLGYEARILYGHNQGIQAGLVALGRIEERLAGIGRETAPGVATQSAREVRTAAVSVSSRGMAREAEADERPGEEFLRLEHVHFCYDGGPEVLTDVNVTLHRNEIVGVFGPSGAGKTTLAMVAAGIYRPSSGRVWFAGHLSPSAGPNLRETGVLQQSPHLFTGSIRDNLLLGCPVATEDAMLRALEAAGLAEFVASLCGGLDAGVGVRGQALSVGQRQRLALARLFLRNPSFWILDEPTAPLDSESESWAIRAFRDRIKGKPALLVTHSRAVLDLADRTYELREGMLQGAPVDPAKRAPAENDRAIR